MSSKRDNLGRVVTRTRLRRLRAFTLIEVLAAVAFVAVVVPVAMHGIGLALRASASARRTAEASILAQGKLDELVAQVNAGGAAAVGGGSEENGIYHIDSGVTAGVDPVSLGLSMNELTVQVSWGEHGTQEQVRLSTWVYGGATQ
jgi:type II secretory pathway pseudopilin PulG